jgi:hypothetical protein
MKCMRSEETIEREKESAREMAEDLDDESPLDALAAMVVYRTLNWVEGEGKENLDEELLMIDNDEDI